MKRYGNLFDHIANWEKLCLAAKKAQVNKRYRPNVANYHRDLEKNLVRLREKLISRIVGLLLLPVGRAHVRCIVVPRAAAQNPVAVVPFHPCKSLSVLH